jgi:ADP-heptose:LPS heptosyltransferase
LRRILLVRLRETGDVVFTTPAIRALRQHFPRAHLAYMVEPRAAPIVRANPHLDDVIVAPRQPVWADLALARRLRADRYDLAIDFHGGPRASLLTWLSGARVRVGYDVPGRGWMYTVRVPRPRELRPRHAVENQWDLLLALGLPPPDPRNTPVEMASDPAAAGEIAQRLVKAGAETADDLIVIHVSAGNPFRRWPRPAFAALIASLAGRGSGTRVIVTSGPSEVDAAREIADEARARLPPSQRDRVPDVEELTLAGLRALLDRAALFIGGDSGPLHVAATTSVPIVGLYGPTLPVRSQPWRDGALVTESVEVKGLECRPCDQRVCRPGDFRCLSRLTPEAVVQASERALARGRRPSEIVSSPQRG